MEHLLKVNELKDDTFIQVDEVKQLLQVSRNTLHRITQRGLLRNYKFNGRNYYSTSELKNLVNLIRNGVGYYSSVNQISV
jgi:predicted site-specific integrase-resolvase